MQRWAWNWTGDVATTWASMRQQMATVIGLGLSGVPYSGPDIGGFSGVPDDELYVRWLQMSVMLPYCRTHSVLGAPPREPWRFEEPARRAIAAWLRFRYRLLPYLYTLAHEASACGAPLVRPVWWPGPAAGAADGAAPDLDDAFMLGNALLVAPVTVPGAAERTVALPAGQWRSLWGVDGEGGEGGRVVRLDAPAGRIPVLVRAGSIVPLDDGWRGRGDPCRLDTDLDFDAGRHGGSPTLGLDHAPSRLAFHCWPTEGGDAEGVCIDDAGDGDGPARRDTLQLTGAVAGATAVVRWNRSGTFPSPTVVRVVLHGCTAESATADGERVAVRGSSLECGVFSDLRLEGVRPVRRPRL
jgi:alpha-glucosidase